MDCPSEALWLLNIFWAISLGTPATAPVGIILNHERNLPNVKDLIRTTASMGLRLGLLLAVVAWVLSQWQVFGATSGPFSCAAGPGGWEICRWNVDGSKSFSVFMYSAAEEALGSPAGTTRHWGVFVYHWLLVVLIATFYGLLLVAFRNRRPLTDQSDSSGVG